MVNSTLDIEAIRIRAGALALDHSTTRDVVLMSGRPDWPLGDRIMATLADVESLATEVEALRSELAKREPEADPLRSALIGILRADGYMVVEPIALAPIVLPSAWEHNDYAEDSPRCGTFTGVEPGPRVCPNCEQPLPPNGKCTRYLDCAKADASDTERPTAEPEFAPKPLENGAAVRIVGGLWDGRYAVALGTTISEHGQRHCVQVTARGIELTSACRNIDAAQVCVVNPTVDAPIVKTGPVDTAPAKPKRAPEPPKLVTEWAPDGRDFEGYAKSLGLPVTEIPGHVARFKQEIHATTPDQKQARWGGTFKEWAKARLQTTT